MDLAGFDLLGGKMKMMNCMKSLSLRMGANIQDRQAL